MWSRSNCKNKKNKKGPLHFETDLIFLKYTPTYREREKGDRGWGWGELIAEVCSRIFSNSNKIETKCHNPNHFWMTFDSEEIKYWESWILTIKRNDLQDIVKYFQNQVVELVASPKEAKRLNHTSRKWNLFFNTLLLRIDFQSNFIQFVYEY